MSVYRNSAAPRLSVVSNDVPDPPYPANTKSNGWKPELDIDRIITSDSWVLAEDEERCWLLRIWMECWRSVPVGTMPQDRLLFARRIGCTRAFLDAHAEILLRGWVLHSDGNLYHGYVTDLVQRMLANRLGAKLRMEKSRAARKNPPTEGGNGPTTPNSGSSSGPVTRNSGEQTRAFAAEQEQEQEQEESFSLSPKPPPSPAPEVAPATAVAGVRERHTQDPPVPLPAKAASPPSRQVAPTTWPGFDAFWGAYPAKKAKQDALKAWNKLRLPPGDVDAIQADLPLRLATDRSWREGYIPNPATYLNGRRWEDAITPIQAVRPGGRVVSLAERNQAVLDRFVNGGSEFGDFIEGECRHA